MLHDDNAIPVFDGKWRNSSIAASNPPAEPPTPTIGQIRFDLSRLRLAVLPNFIAGFEGLDLFRRRGQVAITDRRRVRVLRRRTPLFVAFCLAGMFLTVRPAFHPHKPCRQSICASTRLR